MTAKTKNTDQEIWSGPDDGRGSYYADSIHVTEGGGIGIDVGGHVIVRPLRNWHAMAARTPSDYTAWLVEMMWGDIPVYFQLAYDDDWTKDHDQALHFCRKIDAERCIEHYGWTMAKPIEHMWPKASAVSSQNGGAAT